MGTHLFVGKVEQLLELDATVRECAEGPLFLEVGRDLRVGDG